MATIITREQLIAKFEEIESVYSVFYSAVYPDFLYTPKQFTARDEATLTALAESLLQPERVRAERLQTERTKALAEFAEQPTALLAEKQQKTKAVTEWEEDAVFHLSLDAIARNMHKSAFYLSHSATIHAEGAQKRAMIEEEYQSAIEALAQKEAEIHARYDALVAEAEAAYLSALAAKKQELLLAESARAEKVLEYNNDMEKEAIAYTLQAVNGMFDRANDDTVTRASMMYEKMQACHDYLSNFTTADALTAVSTDELYSKYLGSYGSRALVAHYQAKYDAEQAS